MKRCREQESLSEACTESTSGACDADERSLPKRGGSSQAAPSLRQQKLDARSEEDAAARLELEMKRDHCIQQQQHLRAQLEQLEGCEEPQNDDSLGISDMQQQLKVAVEQERHVVEQLEQLEAAFQRDVADLLKLPDADQLQQVLQEQQELQKQQVQRIAIEQQLASGGFSLTSSRRKLKKQRVDSISQVWQWLGQQQAAEPRDTNNVGSVTASPAALAAPLPVLEHASSC